VAVVMASAAAASVAAAEAVVAPVLDSEAQGVAMAVGLGAVVAREALLAL
jgi:hypothetical protein